MEEPCKCPMSTCELPKDIYKAAEDGKHGVIVEWLDEGGDVNATRSGWTLLSTACRCGHVNLIRKLINDPHLHVNNRTGGLTPLYIAAINGHTECLQMLLGSSLQCRIDVSANNRLSANESSTALMSASSYNHWDAVKVILDGCHNLERREINCIIDKAFTHNQWEILVMVFQRDYEFDKENLRKVLEKAYREQRWDVITEILKKGIRPRNLNVGAMLFNRISNRDWNNVSPLLALLSSQVVLNSTLADAVLQDDNEITELFLEEENMYITEQKRTVEDLLNQNEYKAANLDAALLVAAVGGTSEAVANQLLGHHRSSDKTVIINALLLSAKYNRLELLPSLLEYHEDVYSYKILSQARHIAAKEQHMDAARLLFRALEIKSKNILS